MFILYTKDHSIIFRIFFFFYFLLCSFFWFMKSHIKSTSIEKKSYLPYNISYRFPLKLLTIEMWYVTTRTWISVGNFVDVLTWSSWPVKKLHRLFFLVKVINVDNCKHTCKQNNRVNSKWKNNHVDTLNCYFRQLIFSFCLY